MQRLITAFSICLVATLTLAGLPEDSEFVRKNYLAHLHFPLKNDINIFARENGITDADLLNRLDYIAETYWNSDDCERRLDAEAALQEIGGLPKSVSVPYLEKQLYRHDAQWRWRAFLALGRFAESDECFYDITGKAAASGTISRDEVRRYLYGIISHDIESPTKLKKEDHERYLVSGIPLPLPTPIDLPANIRARMYRTLLLYPPVGDKSGFTAERYDEKLCKHMKYYAHSKERLEQVALLAANTNASPELREKYAKELEKMRAIPEDELICLLDIYPPTENELAQTRKDVIDKRADVSTADGEPESSVATADGQKKSPRPNGKSGMVTLAVVTVALAVGCAIIFMRRRK